MSKALEITKEIVCATFSALNINSLVTNKNSGEYVAEYFEAIYKKVKELEEKGK